MVKLRAEISGEPAPDVGWLKDGDDINEDDRWVCHHNRDCWRLQLPVPGTEVPYETYRSSIHTPEVTWWVFKRVPHRVYFDVGDTDTILTIKNAHLADTGKYEVFVENKLGVDQSFARLDILWRGRAGFCPVALSALISSGTGYFFITGLKEARCLTNRKSSFSMDESELHEVQDVSPFSFPCLFLMRKSTSNH